MGAVFVKRAFFSPQSGSQALGLTLALLSFVDLPQALYSHQTEPSQSENA